MNATDDDNDQPDKEEAMNDGDNQALDALLNARQSIERELTSRRVEIVQKLRWISSEAKDAAEKVNAGFTDRLSFLRSSVMSDLPQLEGAVEALKCELIRLNSLVGFARK